MGPDRLHRVYSVLAFVFAAVLLAAAGLVGAYLLDTRDGPRTIRGLEVADRPAGDLTREELSRVVARLRGEAGGMPVRIDFPTGAHHLLGADLGITIDEEAMTEAAIEAGESSNAWERFWTWAESFTTNHDVPLMLSIDRKRASETVGRLDGLVVTKPTEPRLVMTTDEELTVDPGSPGEIVDVDAVVERLAAQVEEGGPLRLVAPTVALPPSIDRDRLAAVAEEVNELSANGVTVQVGEEERHLGPSALRVRLDVEQTDGVPRPVFDMESLQFLIEHTFSGVKLGGEDPVFDVVDDEPVLVEPGTPPLECCAGDAAETVADAVLQRGGGTVRVDPKPTKDRRLVEWARGEGVVEKVAEFTTNHACCEARVSNIQRFADIVRGAYLVPGETLSLNGYVGERTSERGFVPAGTIIRGHLVPTVGGGVSQFATTMFNAAFFAGFDFITYQSHSLYISRYPYGREATISWPAPDLEFENTTDYPALIWTSYTDTSITVSIYSTQSVEVEQIGQETSPAGACTRVDTFRRRTYPDGRQVEDSVFATYRPSEGFDCAGNPTDRPNL